MHDRLTLSLDGDHVVAAGPGGARWRAEDLRRDVGHLTARLAADGGGVDRLVLCRGRYAFAVAALACWAVGDRVVLPASPAPDALAALRGGASVVHDGADDGVHALAPGAIGAPLRGLDVDADAVLAVLSTSGSTGAGARWPKTARQLLGEARLHAELLGLAPGDAVLATVPPQHIYGLLFSVLVPLLGRAALSDDAPLFPEAVAARAQEHGATVLITVPAHLRVLTTPPVAGLGGLRAVLSSGAPLPPEVAAAAADVIGVDVTEVLGSTETGGIATRQQRRTPRWTPLPGVRVHVDDALLHVDSDFVPADQRPWRAADRAHLHDDGTFEHLGRADDVIKLGSRRVSLGQVDAALHAAPGVRDAALVLVPREGRDPVLHAFVAADVPLEGVRQALLRTLDPVAVPRLHAVDALPREATGKLPRQRLLDLVSARTGGTSWAQPVAVAADHPAFAGHFPGMPILPGAALLQHVVAPVIRRGWPDLAHPDEVELVTFQRPVRPGDVVTVSVTRDGRRARFVVDGPEGRVANGSLSYRSS